MTMIKTRLPIALGLVLGLAGCISFGPKPPASLLTLTAAQAVPAQASRSATAGETIGVLAPAVSQELRTNRVPVRSGETAVAYLKDAQWVEMPGALFGRLLSETIAARTGRVVLGPGQTEIEPGTSLSGQLQAFGVDASRMDVALVYDAVLTRSAGRIETRRFEARVPITAVDTANAGPALNQAANQVAAEVAAWIGG
jgi:cholesterol transport system auxiliary component